MLIYLRYLRTDVLYLPNKSWRQIFYPLLSTQLNYPRNGLIANSQAVCIDVSNDRQFQGSSVVFGTTRLE